MTAIHFNEMTVCDGWDTHSKNFEALAGELLPMLDQSLSALLDDLAARGTLDETLVIVMGEFGRTPKINAAAGRDHWGSCQSVLLAGGGVRGGRVIGASDKSGAFPTTRRSIRSIFMPRCSMRWASIRTPSCTIISVARSR